MAKKKKEKPAAKIHTCPFGKCGGKGKVSKNPWGIFVVCNKCGAAGPNWHGQTEAQAIETWNNRV